MLTAPRATAAGRVALILVLFVFAYAVRIYEYDTWGHLRYGAEIIRQGRVLTTDSFSFTCFGQEWLNHEWLGQVVIAGVFQAAGEPGLVLLKTLLGMLTGWLMWRALPAGAGRFPLLVLLAALLAPSLVIRPQLFTYLGLALLMTILRRVRGGELPPARWLIPLFLVWANLHGGFFAGIGILLLLGAPLVLTENGRWSLRAMAETSFIVLGAPGPLPAPATPGIRFRRHLLLLILLAILATLVNPYGAGIYHGVLRGITNPFARAFITEWLPLRLSFAKWHHLLFLVVAPVFLAGIVRRPRPVAEFILAGALVVFPLLSARHLPLFAVLAPFVWRELPGAWARRLLAIPAGTVLLLALAGVGLDPAPRLAIPARTFPVHLVTSLREQGARGNCLVEYDWGEFVTYALGPELRVAVDGRCDNVYPVPLLIETAWRLAAGDWDDFLARYPADCALLRRGNPGLAALEARGWRRGGEDELAVWLTAPR